VLLLEKIHNPELLIPVPEVHPLAVSIVGYPPLTKAYPSVSS
jgi:hypothetical protein